MKTNFNHLLTTGLLIGVLSLNSCKKEEINTIDSKETKTENLAKSAKKQQQLTNTVFQIGTNWVPRIVAKNAAYMKTDDNIESGIECATITIDSSSSPRIATVVFDGGCTSSQSHNISGKITFEYTDPTMETGHMFLTFDNLSYDGMLINGTMDYNSNGRDVSNNISGDITFNVSGNFERDKIILNGTTTISFNWVASRNTAYLTVTGTTTDNNGIVFNQSTNAPLGLKLDDGCEDHFVSGKLLLQSAGLDDEEIDYGTGDCDDQATSTVNGVTTNITLN